MFFLLHLRQRHPAETSWCVMVPQKFMDWRDAECNNTIVWSLHRSLGPRRHGHVLAHMDMRHWLLYTAGFCVVTLTLDGDHMVGK